MLYTYRYTMSKMNNIVTITVDRTSDEPVYEQIARKIRLSIVAGEPPAGASLPSVRVLASDLGVNLNTVARAYRILEQEGFVRIEDRSGVIVVPPTTRTDVEEKQRLCESLRLLLARMRQAGVTREELRQVVESALAALYEDRREAH
jgi:GntR family transcriptional regulator